MHPRLDAQKQYAVFASDRQTAQDYDLYLADLSAGSCAQLTGLTIEGNDDLSPAWSPDGSQIVFERRLAGGGRDLVRVDLASGAETALGLTAFAPKAPAWSPDGLALLFACTVDEAEGLCRVGSSSGSEAKPLALDPNPITSRLIGPVWSPDGQRAAFTRKATGVEGEIWVVELANGSYACVYGNSPGCTTPREAGFDTQVSAWTAGDFLLLTDTAPAIDSYNLTWSRMRALALADGSISELSGPGVFESNPDWRPALPARLYLQFVDPPAQVQTGQEFWMEIGYGNSGELAVPGVLVQLELPDGFTLLESLPPTESSGQSADWLIGDAAAGSSGLVRVRVRAPGLPGTGSFTARISSTSDPTGRPATAVVEAVAAPATATPSGTPPAATPTRTPQPTQPPAGWGSVFLPLLAGP